MGLTKNDPFRVDGCDFLDPTCMVDPKVSCSAMGVCYQVTCSCGSDVSEPPQGNSSATDSSQGDNTPVRVPEGERTNVTAGSRRSRNRKEKVVKKKKKIVNNMPNFIGITGRTMHARQMDHYKAVQAGDIKNAMAKHVKDAPDNSEHKFTMKMLSKHRSNLEKAVTEGIILKKKTRQGVYNE
jgi:hypothetical protein